MKSDLMIFSESGGALCVSSDDNKEYADYIRWHVAPGMAFGTLENNAATRRFLRHALLRLEKDAAKRKLVQP